MKTMEIRAIRLIGRCKSEIKECDARILFVSKGLLSLIKTQESAWARASSLERAIKALEGIVYDLKQKESLSRYLESILKEL